MEREKELTLIIEEIRKEYGVLSEQEKKDFRKYIAETGIEEGRELWDVILGEQHNCLK